MASPTPRPADREPGIIEITKSIDVLGPGPKPLMLLAVVARAVLDSPYGDYG